MKKIIAVTLVAAIALTLTACVGRGRVNRDPEIYVQDEAGNAPGLSNDRGEAPVDDVDGAETGTTSINS